MKKLVALAVVMCFAATCHAVSRDKKTEQAPVSVMKGLIISVNIPQNEIVVKDEKTLIDKVLIVKPEMYKAIKVGDAVEVKTKTGSNIVDNIKVTKAASVEKKIKKKTK
jgi:hypothetical protein